MSKKETQGIRPYLYLYQTEQIISWQFDHENTLISLLLEARLYTTDESTGLINGEYTEYRLFRLMQDDLGNPYVQSRVFDYECMEIHNRKTDLALRQIPFVVFEINQSLLADVADIQVELLNMGSSDVNYSLKSNFPFYTEQFSPQVEMLYTRQAASEGSGEAGEGATAAEAKHSQIRVGVAQGRRYPQGLERPAFIHPSPEPLLASMEKQEQLKKEIRQLINLALTNIEPKRASAESKQIDEQGLEAGLSYIGLELEYGERQIAEIWSMYEGSDAPASINYPSQYSLKTEAEKRQEADELEKLGSKIPSQTYQKVVAKQVATITVGTKIPHEDLVKIYKEIDDAIVVTTDPDVVMQDHEAGFVSTETASQIRGYPKGEVEKAKKDHAERAQRIAAAQSPKEGDPAARGVDDLSNDEDGAKDEKTNSQSADVDPDGKKKVRGEAK